MRPKRLEIGDTIGIAAPASPASSEIVEEVSALIASMGFRYKTGSSLFHYNGYLAGSDSLRAEDLNELFGDREVDAIFCLRGGYGSERLLDKLDYRQIAANPKIFLGYSDITALHIAINQKTDLITFHGPMPASDMLGGLDRFSRASLKAALMNTAAELDIVNPEEYPIHTYNWGTACGKLTGGNLSVIASTMGTPYEIDTRDRILFLEDIGEEPYRIDRMLNQLKLAGKFDAAAGIVLGDWKDCSAEEPERSLPLEEVFLDIVVPCGKPVLSGYKIGHSPPMLTIPIGVRAEISAEDGSFRIIEKRVK